MSEREVQMPTREEIAARAMARADELRDPDSFWEVYLPMTREVLKALDADAILALPSPAPVGDAALLARAEAAEAALAAYRAPGGWRQLADADARRVLGDPAKGVSGIPQPLAMPPYEFQKPDYSTASGVAQQTAAAEAREEGR